MGNSDLLPSMALSRFVVATALVVGWVASFPAVVATRAERSDTRVIDDFESGLARGRWEGSIQRSTLHPSHGRYGLEVKFDAAAKAFSAHFHDDNWSPYERLLFDAFNPEPQPVILSFNLYDAVGGDEPNVGRFDFYRGERKLFLGSGWTRVDFRLQGLKPTSELRPIAIDRIRRFTIIADGQTRPSVLYFDNFRLVAGTESGATASTRAPANTETLIQGRRVTVQQVGPREKILESETVKNLRAQAEKEYGALQQTMKGAQHVGLDTIYSQAELTTAEIGLYLRPLLPWFNNDRAKEAMFRDIIQDCRRERVRLESLLTGKARLPERDDTQAPGPLVPPYPDLHGLKSRDGFFVDPDGRPLFIVSVHGPSGDLQRFFATPLQHIESYSVGGGSRWTVDRSPVYEAFKKYSDTHRVGWDGWCGHLIRDLDSMGGKKENVVICLESPHIREAIEEYIARNVHTWLENPELLYNIMAYELQYICYCDRSQQMFRAWLERIHGSIHRVNEAWGTHYSNFQEIVAPPAQHARPHPDTNRAQWYDWACFNQDRFTDYLVWVKSVVRRYDPVTPLSAGGSSSMLAGDNGTSGIDEEQIINRVDDVILHEGSGSTMGMDLQLALAEQRKPLADPEMNLGRVGYLLPHMLHGKSVIQIWHWPDQPPAEYPHLIDDSPAHGWSWSLQDVSALFHAVLDARRLSTEIAAFSRMPAQVAILYSRTSMLQLPPEMLTWETTPYLRELKNAYEASQFLDTRVTFVSESQILRGKLSDYKVLIVPAVSHERREVVGALEQYVVQGGTVLLLPSSLLSDEYNRPADYLRRLGVEVHHIDEPAADHLRESVQAYDQSFQERVSYRSGPPISLSVQPVDVFGSRIPSLHAQGTIQDITVADPHQTLATFPDGKPAVVSLTRGKGRVYYSATSFPARDLRELLDAILNKTEVQRPVRVQGEDGRPLWRVEGRYTAGDFGRLLYIVNFNDRPVQGRVEVRGGPAGTLFDLRSQTRVPSENVNVPAGETMILRLP